ncbi:MAG: hypothetical protein WAQ28_01960 [Bacteroidia bacterium]
MTIQERKLKLISQLSVIENKRLITEIENLVKKSIVEEYEKSLKPLTEKEFVDKIMAAEKDIKNGKLYTQKEVEQLVKSKFRK